MIQATVDIRLELELTLAFQTKKARGVIDCYPKKGAIPISEII